MGNRLRRDLATGGIYFIYGLLRFLPRTVAIRLCRLLGRGAWVFDKRGRQVTLDNLDRAFGGNLEPARCKVIGEAVYKNLAANIADLSRLSRMSRELLLSLVVEGKESNKKLEYAVSAGRGVILLTPHLGNWELLTAYLVTSGFKVHFLGREPYDPRLRSLFEVIRTSHGASWISRGGAFEKLQEVLARGELAIMLIDQDTGRVRGTFVEFFGEPAWTPTGPAALARLKDSVVIPCALVRLKNDKYRFVVEESLKIIKTGNEEFDDWENTRRGSLAIESFIRQFPEQWTWFHSRWRTRPPDDWVEPGQPLPVSRTGKAPMTDRGEK